MKLEDKQLRSTYLVRKLRMRDYRIAPIPNCSSCRAVRQQNIQQPPVRNSECKIRNKRQDSDPKASALAIPSQLRRGISVTAQQLTLCGFQVCPAPIPLGDVGLQTQNLQNLLSSGISKKNLSSSLCKLQYLMQFDHHHLRAQTTLATSFKLDISSLQIWDLPLPGL